jgi:hypothetical protein
LIKERPGTGRAEESCHAKPPSPAIGLVLRDTGSREENTSKQKTKATVPIQSEPWP